MHSQANNRLQNRGFILATRHKYNSIRIMDGDKQIKKDQSAPAPASTSAKKRGGKKIANSSSVKREHKKPKKEDGRPNMPIINASLQTEKPRSDHDKAAELMRSLKNSKATIKQYVQEQCNDITVFKSDPFTDMLLDAIIEHHGNASNCKGAWGTFGDSEETVQYYTNYMDKYVADAKADADAKVVRPDTIEDVVAAIKYFATTIENEEDHDVGLRVKMVYKRYFYFSTYDPDDINEMRRIDEQQDANVSDKEWALERQRQDLRTLRTCLEELHERGIDNPIKEIEITTKSTNSYQIILGTDRNVASQIRQYVDQRIIPVDLDDLKRDLVNHTNASLIAEQQMQGKPTHASTSPTRSEVNEGTLNHIADLVRPKIPLTDMDFFKRNLDKTSVYVVGGESGCGKTWFCAKGIIPHLKVQNQAYLLYLKIHDADKVANSPPPESRFDGNKNVELWLKAVSAILDNNMSFSSRNNMGVLHAILSILELTRAESAQKLLEGMIEAQAPQLFKNWLHGKSSRPIGKLVIVVDGMEHNLDFARAMIDYHRRCLPRKFLHCTPKMLANACSMMLAGTGLEQVKSKWYNFIDTEPSKCELVTLESPNMKVFSWQFSSHKMLTGEEVKQVLEDGTISSILKTNVRMLMTGLKSILDMKQFQAYSKSNYKLRLTDLFSLPSFMELVAERYMGQTRGLREASAADQREYFRCSWRHMLRQRVLSMKDSRSVLKSSYMKRMGIEGREDIHDDHMMPKGAEKEKARDILTLGIATAHYSMVSPALKFLACACDGDVAAKGDRNSFEDMVKYHIKRMLQVIYGENDDADDDDDDEALICEYVLQAAWPEQPSVTNIASYLDEDMPMTELRDCVWKMTAEHDHDLRSIAQMMKPAEDDENDRSVNRPKKEPQEPKAVLISQKSGDAAQGPDLYSLERDENEPYKFWLNLFQIKDMRTLEGATAAEMVSSLGALTSRNGALDDAIDTDLAEVVEYEGDNNKFAKLLNEIHAAIEANTSMPSEDSSRMVELKMKMTGMPTYAKEVFARFIRRSDSKKAETLEALEASKNRKDIETFAALNDLIELRPLIEKENLKNSFTDTWHDALKVYRVQNTIESIRSSLERELQGVFPDEDVTVRVGDRTVVSKAEASFGSVGAVKGIQSFTKNCLQPTYDCFFDKQQRKWKR